MTPSESQELEQVKSHKAALAQEVEEYKAAADSPRLQLIEAQGLIQEAQEQAANSAAELDSARVTRSRRLSLRRSFR